MARKHNLSQVIKQWLKEENYTFKEMDDPLADFNAAVFFNDSDAINVVVQKKRIDSVLLVTRVILSTLDQKAFATLDKKKKKSFTNSLSYEMIRMNLVYQIYPNIHEMQHIHIEKSIYFDGLTKDRFFDMMTKLQLAVMATKMSYGTYLTPN